MQPRRDAMRNLFGRRVIAIVQPRAHTPQAPCAGDVSCVDTVRAERLEVAEASAEVSGASPGRHIDRPCVCRAHGDWGGDSDQ
eukprot:gene12130-biopygen3863